MDGEFCPRCGTKRMGAFRFCRNCQFDFEGGEQPAAPAPPVAAQPVPTTAPSPGTAASAPAPITPPPPKAPSHRVRNIVAGVVALFVVLAIIGSLGSKTGGSSPSSAPAAAAASAPAAQAVPSAAPSAAPSVAPATPAMTAAPAKILLSLTGNGIKSSKTFRASGDSVDVLYAYDCTNFLGGQGNFAIYFYGANAGGPSIADVLANDLGAKGSDTTTEYLNGATGPFHVEINSECEWTIRVVGTP